MQKQPKYLKYVVFTSYQNDMMQNIAKGLAYWKTLKTVYLASHFGGQVKCIDQGLQKSRLTIRQHY